ncbi:MAG: cation:proton antiporter [Thermoanaerobaculia bacterium]|nr:cation:proton antiporter [Thermoanaerobaculia bacterium]
MFGREFLRDAAVILAASFPVLFLCRRLRLPQIVGFLVTGIAIGPHALGWLADAGRVEGIAEFGVVLILFFVGLQFPVTKLFSLGRTALVGGFLQMSLTTAAIAILKMAVGSPWNEAVFYGMLISVSSTAVILPILSARDEVAAPFAKRFLGISLFQDLGVIPLVLLLPALATTSAGGPSTLAVATRVAVAIVGVVILVAGARFAVPRLLDQIVRLGSRESFTGGVFVVVIVLISLAEEAGVSAAMGAFAAGIVLGESEHVHEIAATLSPFRDLLSSLFFVSIGMLLEPQTVLSRPWVILFAVGAVLLIKALFAHIALLAAGTSPRTAFRAALALATVGEFSFVLATAGGRLGLLPAESQQTFVAVAVVTLTLAPFLLMAGPRLAERLSERVEGLEDDSGHHGPKLARHIVIIGYGLNGRSVGRVLHDTGIPQVVLELDPERVALARRDGVRVIRADATGPEALEAAGVANAAGVVITIQDPDGARRATRLCRHRTDSARIIVRTRYVHEVEILRQAGADEVIPEEFETSIEIVARVLRMLHVPGNILATQLRLLRDEGYLRLRDPHGKAKEGRRLSALLAAGTTDLFLVMPETAADGVTLSDLRLTDLHVAVPAVIRDGNPIAPVPLEFISQAGDTLVLAGAHEDLAAATARLEALRAAGSVEVESQNERQLTNSD